MSSSSTAPKHRWLAVIGLSLAVSVAVVAAVGCGSSNDDGVASATSTTTTTSSADKQEQAMLAFARCMRDNGVPSFPDPTPNADGTFSFQPPTGAMGQQSTQKAVQACRSNLNEVQMGSSVPGTSDRQDALLAVSKCMRANGLPDFPDPKANAGLFGMFKGYDTSSPTFEKAMDACSDEFSSLGIGSSNGGS
jgi:hypothetical protein